MKDIDFDELDKAVNSLMASTNAAAAPVSPVPASPVSEAPVITPAAPQAPSATPADTSNAVNVAVMTPGVQRASPPAIRRSGRFMDMVQSSPDAKPRPTTASRVGISLTPRSEPEAVAAEPVTPPASDDSILTASPDGTMPDPLDLLQPDETPQTTDVEPPTVAEEQSTLMSTIPQESPFLSDAKVDKRPLNSESVFEPEMVSSPTTLVEPDEPAVEDEPHMSDTNKADEPPLSPRAPELDTQLVAIESGSQESTSTDESVAAAVPLGATSISQQYTAQPSSGDQSHAAIYDSSQYPEQLKHPAKPKSGWLWVLWVALLLGVGAGGAILLYNFGIIP